MNARALIAAVAALVMLLPVAAAANGQGGKTDYQVSGGGQLLADSHPGTGPGTTIAFTAQRLADGGARGQFRLIDRGDDGSQRGQDQDKRFGTVTCVEPGDDNTAWFGGVLRDGTPFRVDVTDNGQPVDGTDMILVRYGDADFRDCGGEDPDDDSPYVALGRGNVKIHDRR